jgi:hypothetical protein
VERAGGDGEDVGRLETGAEKDLEGFAFGMTNAQ